MTAAWSPWRSASDCSKRCACWGPVVCRHASMRRRDADRRCRIWAAMQAHADKAVFLYLPSVLLQATQSIKGEVDTHHTILDTMVGAHYQ